MRYSFTQPLPKSIISGLTKIWIFYIVLSVGILYLYGIYLNMQKNTLSNNTQFIDTNIQSSDESASKIENNIARLQDEAKLFKTNQVYNTELKNAMKKIFDLIPDQITITQIVLDERQLTLKGITPSTQNYAFLLQPSLKSIFTTSNVNFFQQTNGWYNFTSISTLKDEDK